MESLCRFLGKIDLEFQIPQAVEVQEYPPYLNRRTKGVRFFRPPLPRGCAFLHSGLVLHRIGPDATPVLPSVSSEREKYTPFKDSQLYQKSPGREVDRGDRKCRHCSIYHKKS